MVADEQLARADIYAILAAGLRTPMTRQQFDWLAALATDVSESPLKNSWEQLAKAAKMADVESESEEFHRLFVGMSGGVLTPYASWYVNGTMFSQALVGLRTALLSIGVATPEQESEPEDHLGYLLNVMQYLISVQDNESAKMIMDGYIHSWVQRFCSDLSRNSQSLFYRAFANLLVKFLEVESIYYFGLKNK
ncbi:Chaperone protein TorD [Sinobacterium norvegicum]|uniref:Chaperone protein TorD n=1 Tax=Sinobacterium norvegicum TaxID=1641715 RepID=A0ABM9AHQ4_9GAMM|nr:molecular chaperone TorD family protein [Sinobacterium norvegicum]CAH0992758.1 Chaperone protein TorD [Sinobacterium norvegicum]